MDNSSTPLKKKKVSYHLVPRKHVIDNILNYSKSLDVFSTSIGNILISNN